MTVRLLATKVRSPASIMRTSCPLRLRAVSVWPATCGEGKPGSPIKAGHLEGAPWLVRRDSAHPTFHIAMFCGSHHHPWPLPMAVTTDMADFWLPRPNPLGIVLRLDPAQMEFPNIKRSAHRLKKDLTY
jgi:hypothetical protein